MTQFEEDCIKYSFTPSQKIAVSEAIDFISKPFDENKFIIAIDGAGGTGKTYITNYIINNCRLAASTITCCSPTHKACRIFSNAINGKEVNTIQSTFGFRLNLNLADFDPNNPQFNPMATPKIEQTKLLIIDEVSMLPAKIVNYIFKICRLSQIKVIGLGDAYQLAPVNEKTSLFFHKCFKIYTLTEVVRQGENNPISDLLNILRDDIKYKTYNFIKFVSNSIGQFKYNNVSQGWCVVGKDEFREYINTKFNDEAYTKNIDLYRIIAYTNNAVSNWNSYVRNEIIRDADKKIITRNDLIMSYETIVDDFLSVIINNSEEYIVHEIVDYIDPTYKFKGFLIKFQLVNGGHITKPLFIIDHKDRFTILAYYKVVNQFINNAKRANAATRNSKWKEYYNFKKTYLLAANLVDSTGRIVIDRDIDYGFSITSHKSQGSTYNTVFVDLNDIIYDKNGNIYTKKDELLRLLYVACSRAKNELILCYGK